MAITVTAEDLSGHGELDAIVVRIDGEEVGSFCIVDDAKIERWSVRKMVDAIMEHERKKHVRRT